MLHLPATFVPPRSFVSKRFRLEALSASHCNDDFRAVTKNAAHIRGVFGPTNEWPHADITFEENHADLVRHER